MNYPFYPYGQFQPDMYKPNQSQIQNLSSTTPTQVQCYFVTNPKDMEQVKPLLNVIYVGINKEKNEVYLKQLNINGLIDFNTYSLAGAGQEKSDFTKIMDRIEQMEKKFLTKGQIDERNTTNANATNDAGAIAEQSPNANV